MEREDLARSVPKRGAPNKVAPEQYGGVYIPIEKPKVMTISDSVHINSIQSEPWIEVIFSNTTFPLKFLYFSQSLTLKRTILHQYQHLLQRNSRK